MKIHGIFVDGKDLIIHLSFWKGKGHIARLKSTHSHSVPSPAHVVRGLASGGKSGHITGISGDMTNLQLWQVAWVPGTQPPGIGSLSWVTHHTMSAPGAKLAF